MITIYEVGGAVRDSFRDVSSNDIDFAVEAPSYLHMKDYVIKTGAQIFIEHPEFVTIRAKWCPPNQTKQIPCDFTLCRKEDDYKDNRHPSFIEPGTILEDLARRDFTINAIARNCETGEILDPYEGIQDIKQGFIRCVGDPFKRFEEDALRVMRALRFSIVMGYDIVGSTDYALHTSFSLLDNISAERIRDELYKIFKFNSLVAIKELSKYTNYQLSKMFNERTGIWLEPTMKDK